METQSFLLPRYASYLNFLLTSVKRGDHHLIRSSLSRPCEVEGPLYDKWAPVAVLDDVLRLCLSFRLSTKCVCLMLKHGKGACPSRDA